MVQKKPMRDGCLIMVGLAILFMFGCGTLISSGSESSRESSSLETKLDPQNTVPAEACAKSEGMIARAFPWEDFNNSAPGVLYLPSRAWTHSSADEKGMIGQALALQKACEYGLNMNTTTVEIRSIHDNSTLARGTHWEITQQ